MWIIIGSFKGEIFVVGHTTSIKRAQRFIIDFPHGTQNEYDWVEYRNSVSI